VYLPVVAESAQLLAPAALNPAQPTAFYPIKIIHVQDHTQQLSSRFKSCTAYCILSNQNHPRAGPYTTIIRPVANAY
jgi:hypothetical protein